MKKAFQVVSNFILRYPAVLASYFIYGYYFISTMDFYITFKSKHFSTTDALRHFDTLLWMWLLSYVLVKVIELRERLYKKETEMLEKQHDLSVRGTQIQTLHEVITTLKHQINNPLAVIMGYTRLLRKQVVDPEASKKINEIEKASQRINLAIKEFSAVQAYEVSESQFGNLVELTPSQLEKK